MYPAGRGSDSGPDHGRRFLPPVHRDRRGDVDGGDQHGAPAAVGGPGPRSARPDRVPRRRRHHRTHLRAAQGRDGHLLQGHLGVRAADRVAGQHQRGALPGQPARQRAQPRRRGGLDRQGDRAGGSARRAGVPARGHRLLADRALRPVGRAGRFRVRHGLQRGAALPRRGAARGVLGTTAAARPRPAAQRAAAPTRTQPQAAHRRRTRLCQPRTQPARTSPSSPTSPANAPEPTG